VSMKEAVIYILSDGQKSQFSDLEKLEADQLKGAKPVSLQMVQLKEADQQNLTISSLTLQSQMLSRDTPLTLQVKVKNAGEATVANQFISLETEGRIAGQY